MVAERKLVLEAVAKTWELKGAGDAVETQRFADEQLTPMVARYLKAQDEFIAQLERRREAVREEATAQRIRLGVISTLTALVVFAAGALLAWLLVRSITAPLEQAVDTANAIAAGDLTRELQTSRKDELGQMLRALNAMSARLRGVVSEVRQGVDSVSSASIQIATGNHDLSARTEQTAANLEETRGQHGRADRHRHPVGRHRPPGQPVGQPPPRRPPSPWRRSGGPGGHQHAADHRKLQPQDQRHHWRDRLHCLPDQHPGAERRRGSRPRWRARPWLCRGGQGGAQSGPAAAPKPPRKSRP